MIRRLYRFGQTLGPAAGRLAFALAVVAAALFWAWLETMLFVERPSRGAAMPGTRISTAR